MKQRACPRLAEQRCHADILRAQPGLPAIPPGDHHQQRSQHHHNCERDTSCMHLTGTLAGTQQSSHLHITALQFPPNRAEHVILKDCSRCSSET
jgi:hypothetical protein